MVYLLLIELLLSPKNKIRNNSMEIFPMAMLVLLFVVVVVLFHLISLTLKYLESYAK